MDTKPELSSFLALLVEEGRTNYSPERVDVEACVLDYATGELRFPSPYRMPHGSLVAGSAEDFFLMGQPHQSYGTRLTLRGCSTLLLDHLDKAREPWGHVWMAVRVGGASLVDVSEKLEVTTEFLSAHLARMDEALLSLLPDEVVVSIRNATGTQEPADV